MKTISIKEPKELKIKKFYNQLEKMIYEGEKVSLELAFITDDPQKLFNEFQLLKNDICFKRDIKNGKFKK